MATYVKLRVHALFAVSRQRPDLGGELGPRVHSYLAGIARRMGVGVPAAGGGVEHVHLLLDLPSTLALADCMRILKGASSKWLSKLEEMPHGFAWEPGYAAFSIGVSRLQDTIDYIHNQQALHEHLSFRREYEKFLEANRLDAETIGGLLKKTGGG